MPSWAPRLQLSDGGLLRLVDAVVAAAGDADEQTKNDHDAGSAQPHGRRQRPSLSPRRGRTQPHGRRERPAERRRPSSSSVTLHGGDDDARPVERDGEVDGTSELRRHRERRYRERRFLH